MPVIDNPNLGPEPTVPLNLNQGPRFGGIVEATKDAFVEELTNFFSTAKNQLRLSSLGVAELPRIDKYSVAVDVTVDPLETAVNLIRSYPDIEEDLPLIAVLSTTGHNLKLNIADTFVGVIVPPARVQGGAGPFNVSGGTLTVTSIPDGDPTNPITSTFSFVPSMFIDATAATLDEVVRVINFQALYVTAEKWTTGDSTVLSIRAGGPKGRNFPNSITIIGGTSVTALGLTVNQTNLNYGSGKMAYTRHMIAADLTVALEVVTESENIRTELSDLLFDFLVFVMADRQFQFFGRSIFDQAITDETYQIILKDKDISIVGEQEMPRPGDPRDKIYVNRINVPVSVIQYTDRLIVTKSGATLSPPAAITLSPDDNFPVPN